MKSKAIKLLAVLMAFTFVFAFASCGKDENANDTTAAAETEAQVTEEIVTEEIVTDEAETVAGTEAATEAETEAATEAATEAETTEAAAPAEAPTETADILKLYNDATAKAANNKVAFSKKRESTANTYEAGVALKAFKGLVYQFMGIGPENIYTKEVAKGDSNYSRYLTASTLSASDVTSAKCTADENGNFTVTIGIKSGSSNVIEGNYQGKTASLDKCGISSGEGDKDYYDHKGAQNTYDAIDDVAASATIKETYNNAQLKAVIDAEGNLTSLVVTFDIAFDISRVYGAKGNATASTVVTFSNFKW